MAVLSGLQVVSSGKLALRRGNLKYLPQISDVRLVITHVLSW